VPYPLFGEASLARLALLEAKAKSKKISKATNSSRQRSINAGPSSISLIPPRPMRPVLMSGLPIVDYSVPSRGIDPLPGWSRPHNEQIRAPSMSPQRVWWFSDQAESRSKRNAELDSNSDPRDAKIIELEMKIA
jgi:hypothetical protein